VLFYNDDGNLKRQGFNYDRHQCAVRPHAGSHSHGTEMKVTKAQAQANRARVVETAATLFRERGYDGVGVADVMAAAGLTHGGFYKNFGSKTELMAESAACALARNAALPGEADIAEFVQNYLSRKHRDCRTPAGSGSGRFCDRHRAHAGRTEPRDDPRLTAHTDNRQRTAVRTRRLKTATVATVETARHAAARVTRRLRARRQVQQRRRAQCQPPGDQQ
jgi:AcrR family transcriptional regulator